MANTQTYNYNDIQRYLQHTMTPQEMHAFEKALMNDAFLADALDGFLSADAKLTAQHLLEIESNLTGKKEEAKVVAMPLQKKTWWKVAAAAIVLFAVGGLTYLLNIKPNAEYNIAQQKASDKAAEIVRNADSIQPAKEPLARVELSTEIKKYSQPANASLAKRKSTMPTNKTIQEKTDSQSFAMAGKSEEVSALMNKRADAATALRAPAAADASRIMESKKVAKSAPFTDTNSAEENDSLKNSITKDNEAEAEPEGGWENFEKYILRETNNFRANIRNYYKQEIELEFLINNSGRPDNIKVSQPADKQFAEKAIEILTNGPKWSGKKKDKTVKIIITF